MKKLFIFLLVLSSCLSANAYRSIVIKVGQTMTIYRVIDYGESNYWGRNVAITKEEISLPDDAYYQSLGIPKKEWECFLSSNNGAYDTELDVIQKERNELRQDYNKLFAKNSQQEKTINLLEIFLALSVLISIFLGLKMARDSFRRKLKSAIL